jgi:hypothetical protein
MKMLFFDPGEYKALLPGKIKFTYEAINWGLVEILIKYGI